MSCGYDFKCSCGARTSLDANHAGAEFAELLRHRPTLTDAGGVLAALDGATFWFITGDSGRLELVARFFWEHRDHEIWVQDEYGNRWGACGKELKHTCPRCQCRCTQDAGHTDGCR
jgi:hypothetical protein